VGYKVNVLDSSYEEVVGSLANEIEQLHIERHILEEKSKNTSDWIKQFYWYKAVERVYSKIESE
jgi:hypothetical protein